MSRPSSLLRPLLRAPTLLYRLGGGRILGHRFLLLVHRGRRSGRSYRTVLEVVRWDEGRREAIVMSGFGPESNWYLNVLAGNAEEIEIAGEAFRPVVRRVEESEAVEVLGDYEGRNRLAKPAIHAVLSRLAGSRYDGSEAARRELVSALPLVGFRRETSSGR